MKRKSRKEKEMRGKILERGGKEEVKKKEKQDGKEEGLVLVRQEREKKIERDPIF